MTKRRHTTFQDLRKRLRPAALLLVALFMVAGLVLAYRTQAATYATSLEAEAGVPAGNAAETESLAGASASAAVRFGGGTQPTGPTLYVATNGNDGNAGTSAGSPKKTITAALSAAEPGHTILVAPGTYTGNLLTNRGGSPGKYITIKSQEKWAARIYGNNSSSRQSAVEINHEWIRFEGFDVSGDTVRHGIHASANNIQIVHNHIHDICQWITGNTGWKGGAGIQTGKTNLDNVLIDRNVIRDVGAPGSREQLVHGMYIDSHVTNTVVSNNIIFNIEDFGLHPYPVAESSGWVFVNNVIYNTGRGILQSTDGVTRNNIVYNTRGARYDIRGTGNVVSNNIGGGSGSGSQSGVTVTDPMFVNAGQYDFRLRPGSPGIDKGTATDAPELDFLGVRRPQGGGIDIGAHEQ